MNNKDQQIVTDIEKELNTAKYNLSSAEVRQLVKYIDELVMAEKEKTNKYVIPMVEVNNKLKQEYDRGRLDEAKNILRIGRENDGVNLVWLAARCFLLEEELKQPQTSSQIGCKYCLGKGYVDVGLVRIPCAHTYSPAGSGVSPSTTLRINPSEECDCVCHIGDADDVTVASCQHCQPREESPSECKHEHINYQGIIVEGEVYNFCEDCGKTLVKPREGREGKK